MPRSAGWETRHLSWSSSSASVWVLNVAIFLGGRALRLQDWENPSYVPAEVPEWALSESNYRRDSHRRSEAVSSRV
jgi:hypothetical protein